MTVKSYNNVFCWNLKPRSLWSQMLLISPWLLTCLLCSQKKTHRLKKKQSYLRKWQYRNSKKNSTGDCLACLAQCPFRNIQLRKTELSELSTMWMLHIQGTHNTPGCLLLLEPVSRLLCLDLPPISFCHSPSCLKQSFSAIGFPVIPYTCLSPYFWPTNTCILNWEETKSSLTGKESEMTAKSDGWSIHSGGEHDALIYSGMHAPIPPLKVNLLLCYKMGLASL